MINNCVIIIIGLFFVNAEGELPLMYASVFICLFISFFWPLYHNFIFDAGTLLGRYTYCGIPLKKTYQRNQIACIKLISKQEPIMDGYPPFTLIVELNGGSYDIIRLGFYSRSQILAFFSKTDLKFEEHHKDARLV
jgi:hypothetical protein